jgi:hypothetical protein
MKTSIKYNQNLEKIFTAIFGFIGMLAIFINLHLKGYSNENWLDAIKDLAGLIVVLAVFIASVRISKKPKTFAEVARTKLVDLQKLYPNLLMGPRYNRENYDPEIGKGKEYLFIINSDKKLKYKTKFIPIQPLEEGILSIYVQAGTLADALNYGRGNVKDEEILVIKNAVKKALQTILENKYKDDYEILEDSKDTAIIIDFDEQKMGKRKFAQAILECSEEAIVKLKSFRKD